MKTISLCIALFSMVLVNAQDNWKIDNSHSSIRFSVDHMVISEVEGQFTQYVGTVVSKAADFSDAQVKFAIDINSVNTTNAKRDAHLKTADFFDVEKFPSLTFESSSVEKIKENLYKLKGSLTLHGVSKDIELTMKYGGTVKDPWGNTKAGLKVTGVINRTDFGLKYNSVMEAGGLLIGEDISISCKIELVKA